MKRISAITLTLILAITLFAASGTESLAASKPGKVTGVSAKAASSSSINLKWKKVKSAQRYQIYKVTKKGNKKIATVKGASKNTYTVKGLKSGTRYYFRIKAVNKNKITGAFSKKVSAKTAIKPKKVTGVSAKEASPDSVYLTWNKVKGASGYQIRMATEQGSETTVTVKGASNRSYIVKDLKSGATYRFRIRAFNNTKEYGAFSETVSVSLFKKDADESQDPYKTDAEGNQYLEKSVDVYRAIENGENTKDGKITLRFYKELPNVPYVSVRDHYATVMKNSKKFNDPQMKVEKQTDGTYLLTSETGKAVVDVEKDTLTTDDLMSFINQYTVLKKDDGCTTSSSLPFCRTISTQYEKKEVSYDMGKYSIDVHGEAEDVYFPAATLSDLGADTFMHYSTYNGANFYCNENVDAAFVNTNEDDFYGVRLKNAADGGTRPKDLAEFSYNELCFSIDYFHGKPGKETIHEDLTKSGLDAALKKLGEPGEKVIELLKSSDYADYFAGISKLQLLLEDGGHTQVTTISNQAMSDKELGNKYQAVNRKIDPLFEGLDSNVKASEEKEQIQIARKAQRKEILKSEDGSQTYIRKGDTAICILDEFDVKIRDVWEEYYAGNVEKPAPDNIEEGLKPDPVLIVMEAVGKAEADPEVKNLIIDISNSRGDETDEMIAVIAMLTGNRIVTTHTKNAYTGVVTETTTEVDCNLDKKFDENDNLKHGLNIGVLTSSYSYSCGTGFSMYMKESGIPILGEKTGGGSCRSELFATPEGFIFSASSGLVSFSEASGKTYDEGVPVDTDLLQYNNDGSVKEITMVVPGNQDYPEDGNITVTMPDYSEFYNIDRLSKEMKSFFGTEFNYFAIGNSITRHGVCEYWWNDTGGMAASTVEKDYVHRVSSHLEEEHGEVHTFAYNFSRWEKTTERAETLKYLDPYLDSGLNLVTVQLSENASNLETFEEDFSELIKHIRERAPEAQIIIIDDFWAAGDKSDIKKRVASINGLAFADLGSIKGKPEYQCGLGTVVYDPEGGPHIVEHSGVAGHPGDLGMEYIANAVIDLLK